MNQNDIIPRRCVISMHASLSFVTVNPVYTIQPVVVKGVALSGVRYAYVSSPRFCKFSSAYCRVNVPEVVE